MSSGSSCRPNKATNGDAGRTRSTSSGDDVVLRPCIRGTESSTGSLVSMSQHSTPQTSLESVVPPGPALSDASTEPPASPARRTPKKKKSLVKIKARSPASSSGGQHSEDEVTDAQSHAQASRGASTFGFLGDLASSSVDSLAGLWTVTELPHDCPETDASLVPIREEENSDAGSDFSENFDLQTGASERTSRSQGRESSGIMDASFRNLSVLFSEGLWPAAVGAEDASHDWQTSAIGDASSSSSMPTAAQRQLIDFDELRKEVRRPFQLLLAGIPAPGTECDAFLSAKVFTEESRQEEPSSPLLSAVARSRLIGRILGCCDAVLCELSHEEVHLWDAFMTSDVHLRGALPVKGEELQCLLQQLTKSTDRIVSWTEAIAVWADDNDEVDFADLLDWFDGERQKNNIWAFQTSLRSSFVQLLGSTTSGAPSMRMRPELLATLRGRLAPMSAQALATVAACCQRTLILTSWCQCERRLLALVKPALRPPAQGQDHGPPPGIVSALIAVLRGINSELAPTERVLWELLGTKDMDFDGTVEKSEVLGAIGELLVYSIERELGTAESEFEELQALRADCRRRSVEALFEDPRRTKVTLADVIKWWWDMSEEYRVAAGLSVPANLLRRSLHRRPEEMFRDKLPRVAADPAAAKVALKGHSGAFAQLRALATSRAVENLNGRDSPRGTWTTNTSEPSCDTKDRADDAEEDNEEESSNPSPAQAASKNHISASPDAAPNGHERRSSDPSANKGSKANGSKVNQEESRKETIQRMRKATENGDSCTSAAKEQVGLDLEVL